MDSNEALSNLFAVLKRREYEFIEEPTMTSKYSKRIYFRALDCDGVDYMVNIKQVSRDGSNNDETYFQYTMRNHRTTNLDQVEFEQGIDNTLNSLDAGFF